MDDDVIRLDLNTSSQSISRCSRFRASIRTCAPEGIRRASQTLSDLDDLMDFSDAEDIRRVSRSLSDMDDDLADDDLSLIVKMDLDSDIVVQSNAHDGHKFYSYSSDEESLPCSNPLDFTVNSNHYSMERVPNFEFNEEYLLAALHSIGSRANVSRRD